MKILIGLATASLIASGAIAQSTTNSMNNMSTMQQMPPATGQSTSPTTTQTAPTGTGTDTTPPQSTTTTTDTMTSTTDSSSTAATTTHHAKKHCHWVKRHGKKVRSCSTGHHSMKM